MQLNPARGRKHFALGFVTAFKKAGFMQLNPARGRKLVLVLVFQGVINLLVYAAQPREGTET